LRTLDDEIAQFRKQREDAAVCSLAFAATLMTAGIKLEDVLKADSAAGLRFRIKLKRLMERERLKGLTQHASYNLKRHMGLKAAYDMLSR
jgi:hypothetical protein